MYHSYLLRLWRDSEHGAWRLSLESVATGERHGFPDLASLFAFLQGVCQEPAVHRWENPDEQQQ
jgi:hypothetical protein